MVSFLWLQGGCCGGETVSLLNSEQPDFLTFLNKFGLNLIWHPFLSRQSGEEVLATFKFSGNSPPVKVGMRG